MVGILEVLDTNTNVSLNKLIADLQTFFHRRLAFYSCKVVLRHLNTPRRSITTNCFGNLEIVYLLR